MQSIASPHLTAAVAPSGEWFLSVSLESSSSSVSSFLCSTMVPPGLAAQLTPHIGLLHGQLLRLKLFFFPFFLFQNSLRLTITILFLLLLLFMFFSLSFFFFTSRKTSIDWKWVTALSQEAGRGLQRRGGRKEQWSRMLLQRVSLPHLEEAT